MDGSALGYTKLVSLLRRKRRRATRGWLRDSTHGDGPPAQAAAVAPLPVPALTICGAKEEEKNKKPFWLRRLRSKYSAQPVCYENKVSVITQGTGTKKQRKRNSSLPRTWKKESKMISEILTEET